MEMSCIINDFARWTLSLSFINGVNPFDILLSQLPFLIFPLSLLCVLWHLIPVCNVFSSHPHPSLLIPYNRSILVPLFLPLHPQVIFCHLYKPRPFLTISYLDYPMHCHVQFSRHLSVLFLSGSDTRDPFNVTR